MHTYIHISKQNTHTLARTHACKHTHTQNTHLSSGDEQVLQVVSVTSQPVLQGLHKVACVLGLVTGKELEHLGQGAHQLQQTLLKVVVVLRRGKE